MRNGFFKKKKANEEMVLQITSLADILVILLVFLLKTFSTGISSITPGSDIVLPFAGQTDPAMDGLTIQISKNSIQIEDQTIVTLTDFKLETTEALPSGGIAPLEIFLEQQKEIALSNPGETLEKEESRDIATSETPNDLTTRINILADENTPFETIRRVMVSAEHRGFTDYKLVVIGDTE